MINHVSIGVRDIANSRNFYDAVLTPLGYACLCSGEGTLGYGKDAIALWISASVSPVSCDPNSGLHFCFDAPSRKSVDAFYEAALRAGGHDNGKPAIREEYGPNYYAGYVIDPDGYRIEAYCGDDA